LAIASFDRALELNPQLASAYHGRGNARMKRGEIVRAIADFTRALEINPDLSFVYMNRGLALMLQGKDADAQKDFERCVALDPVLKVELARRIEKVKQLRANN